MDRQAIYRKTGAGADAIATRHAALAPKQRSLLILVDGRRTVGELATLGAALGDPAELLQALLAHGYIEPLARKSPVAPAAGARADADGVPLAQARTLAVRRLTDLLGPGATDLCLRLEKTHTVQEFQAAVRRTEATLRQVVGPQRAAQFLEGLDNVRAA